MSSPRTHRSFTLYFRTTDPDSHASLPHPVLQQRKQPDLDPSLPLSLSFSIAILPDRTLRPVDLTCSATSTDTATAPTTNTCRTDTDTDADTDKDTDKD